MGAVCCLERAELDQNLPASYKLAGSDKLIDMILVTGAAGKTGRAVVQALIARGVPVKALVHRPEQTRILSGLGVVEVSTGNLCHSDTVQTAVQGVQAIYYICPNVHPDELAIGKNLITSARSTGIEHFVYHSVLHPQVESMPHHWLKMRVEEQLFESGLPCTILQPTAYMQNILANWDMIVEKGIFQQPYASESNISLVDLEDVAQAAAVVLTEPGHIGATYELAGIEPLSQNQVTAILSEQLGRPVRFHRLPIEEWEKHARSNGMGNYQINTLTMMFQYYDRYGLRGNSNVLSWLLNRQPTSLVEFLKRVTRERANRHME